jgi:aryl-alcohol dehydrogenase-like predicted oxidoreductase
MEFVRIGNSGLAVTEITFGTALTIGTENNNEHYAAELIGAAWNAGIRSFDTSNNYGMGKAEELTGKVLKNYPRQDYVLSTKGSWPVGEGYYYQGLSRKHILWAFEESMKRLDTDYVDIYYAHRPDPKTSMEEIVRTFQSLINSGRVRYWATSEWPLEALRECREACEKLGAEKPIAEQFIYSYAIRKAETNGVIEFCKANKIGMLGFSPLCQGYLTGKYRKEIPSDSRVGKGEKINYTKTSNFYNQNKTEIDHFFLVSDKYAIPPVSMAIQWCIRNNIYPVIGASRPSQLEENVEALKYKIPQEAWDELEAIK